MFSALRMRAAFLFGTKWRGGLPGSFCCISQHCETRSAVQAVILLVLVQDFVGGKIGVGVSAGQ
jgi:hypothetical protein